MGIIFLKKNDFYTIFGLFTLYISNFWVSFAFFPKKGFILFLKKDSNMKKYYTLFIILIMAVCTAQAQRDEVVQNRPYTDLRKTHFGIVVGANFMDLEFDNVGLQTLTMSDGTEVESLVTCDQHNWDFGFNVGVLAEFRLNEYFAFRAAPQLYFGTRNLKFYNFTKEQRPGEPLVQKQSLRTVYVGADLDFIYAAKRHNNHRPYVMAGLAPLFNVTSRPEDYVQINTADIFFEVGLGCDFYLPYFKLRPELKFMLGLTNSLNTKHSENLRNDEMIPYAKSVNRAASKMFVLSFYFE